MFDLEDSLTIESYRIPWLIWIQILIFFLLLFLFYCFSVITSSSDLSLNNNNNNNNNINSSSTSASSSMYLNKGILKKQNSNTNILQHHHSQIEGSQSIKGEIATSTSRTIVREDNIEREGFSTSSIIDFHPCNYFRIAKLAFLKCLGLDLDPTSEHCSSSEHKKER